MKTNGWSLSRIIGQQKRLPWEMRPRDRRLVPTGSVKVTHKQMEIGSWKTINTTLTNP